MVDFVKMLYMFDIGMVVESWYEPTDPDANLDVLGFNFVRLDRRPTIDKRGGGLIMYFREGIDFVLVEESTYIKEEYEIMVVDMTVHEKVFKLIVAYKVPEKHPRHLYKALGTIIDNTQGNCTYIIAGDFNVNYTKANRKAYDIDDFCKLRKLRQVITCNTRVNAKTKTNLDHIYTNSDIVAEANAINVNYSDHYPVYIVLKHDRTKIPKKTVKARCYKKLNMADVYNRIRGADWSDFRHGIDPDRLWKIFHTIITEALSHSAPIRTITVPVERQEWLTELVQIKMRERDKAFKKARSTNRTSDWFIAHTKRNIVEYEIWKSKKIGIIRAV